MPALPADLRPLLHRTADHIAAYRESAPSAAVAPPVDLDGLRTALGGPLPAAGAAPGDVIDRLVRGATPGLVTSVGPRYFGFVIGGALDAATCADLLAAGWDQNAFNAVLSPAAAIVEEVAGEWLKDLLGLPAGASFGFVTGGQAANTVALAAGRHAVLARAGWDVERGGLCGAPALAVIAGEERHATIDRSLRLLGLGTDVVRPVAAGPNGAIDVDALAGALAAGAAEDPAAPTIVCLQAGNVNTGACDDLRAAIAAVRAASADAWVHVDGAFGLWAAADEATRGLVDGLDQADSWAADGHKWLNVPYDCGYVFCRHPDAHAAAMSLTASYLVGQGSDAARGPSGFVLESSRRARGFATWAALCELGRDGVADLVARCCRLARRFADGLTSLDGVAVANDVVLNQVLAVFGDDRRTDAVIAAVQAGGVCWMGGTTWRDRRHMRISVSNWCTTDDDVDRSLDAIRQAWAAVGP